jgi:A/G-specific adenine glycosylase
MPAALLNLASRRRFRHRLLRWYDREKRHLPWRGETDPYRILVSEIMLQQTRVAVVEDRYRKFLQQFSSVSRLARATEDSVLAAWSGLGYYRRARALHAACRQIQNRDGFPSSAVELAELPGIGRYTAAAVASIVFREPVAAVDGNVKRVLQRLAGIEISDNACWQTAQELLETGRPGDFNQAMMELGATICLPRVPLCARCPVVKFCAARGATGRRTKPVRRKTVTLRYLLARRNGAVLLEQRATDLSLMPGMWELPAITGSEARSRRPVLKVRHSITTTDYSILVFSGGERPCRGKWVPLPSVNTLPLTGLARKILRKRQLLQFF